MRVVTKEQEQNKSFVQTLPLSICHQLENIASVNASSRAEVIRAILAEALAKPGFTITLHAKRRVL